MLYYFKVSRSLHLHTDSHRYLLHLSSRPTHVKNSIPFSQFPRLRRFCSNEIDFSRTSEEMLQFFKNRGYLDSVVKTAQQRAQTTNQQSAPQTSPNEENQRIPFTLTFDPANLPVKNIILKNFKLLQNGNEANRIFSLPPLTSFKRNKHISDFLVRITWHLQMQTQKIQNLPFHSQHRQSNRT